MSTPASAPAGERVLLDADALQRTLHRIAHEIIERNARSRRGRARRHPHPRRPLAQRLRRLIEEFAGVEVDLGTLDITFHRDDVHVRGGEAPLHPQPRRRATRSSTSRSRARTVRPRRRRPLHGPHDPRRDRRALRLRPPRARPARRPRRPRPPRAADPPRLRRQEPADRARRARPGAARRGRRGRPGPARPVPRRREPMTEISVVRDELPPPRRRGGT